MKYLEYCRKILRGTSPPTRGCELKYRHTCLTEYTLVTPHAGVRIEIAIGSICTSRLRHPPRGGAN